MPSKDSISGQFADDIRGFESEYLFMKALYKEHQWSMSSIRGTARRFVEGWRYDKLDESPHTPESLDLESKILTLKKLGHNRQSLEYFTVQYGEKLGAIKFKALQERQAYTNTIEYKEMTPEEFRAYNMSRATTLENMVKRYGKEEGARLFSEYRQRQIYTKSRQRYVDEFGEIEGQRIFKEINRKKMHRLENFQEKYGQEEGLVRYQSYIHSDRRYYSRIASSLFKCIDTAVGNWCTCIYEPKTSELCLSSDSCYYSYDFCIPELMFIIEFNGDIFHGNPELFSESDCPNPFVPTRTAKEMWDYDRVKRETASGCGYTVHTIWERDYRRNKDGILNVVLGLINDARKQYNESDRGI